MFSKSPQGQFYKLFRKFERNSRSIDTFTEETLDANLNNLAEGYNYTIEAPPRHADDLND